MKMIALAILCLGFTVASSGCEYHLGGAKIFDATASTEEGRKFVEGFHVKYVCHNVYGAFWSDFYRSKDGVFAIDVERTNDGQITYKPIKEEVAAKLGISPKYSWWDTYGIWVSIPIMIIAILIYLGDFFS